MMTADQARAELEKLALKYLKSNSELPGLVKIINDKTRPGLPVRGVLESIRTQNVVDYDDTEKEIIEELIYLYG
ncbi:MAG: hypothetical protein P8104_05995 [Gammaproteobacteria bacterium]